MTRYDLIRLLLENVEAYENDILSKKKALDTEGVSLEGFNEWMFQHFIKKMPKNVMHLKSPHAQGNLVNVDLSVLLGTLFRYTKYYSKKALDDSPLQSIEEFTYLASLFNGGKMSKTDLINRNVHEKTTGMEIIKRLQKHDFLIQKDDPTDRRSQIIEISESGKLIMIEIFKKMSKVSTLVTGDLNDLEKITLIGLLRKLDNFHHTIFDNDKNMDLDGLLDKHFNS